MGGGLTACAPTHGPHARQWLWQEKANEGAEQQSEGDVWHSHHHPRSRETPQARTNSCGTGMIAQSAQSAAGCESKPHARLSARSIISEKG